jgi:hypothetical protein
MSAESRPTDVLEERVEPFRRAAPELSALVYTGLERDWIEARVLLELELMV